MVLLHYMVDQTMLVVGINGAGGDMVHGNGPGNQHGPMVIEMEHHTIANGTATYYKLLVVVAAVKDQLKVLDGRK